MSADLPRPAGLALVEHDGPVFIGAPTEPPQPPETPEPPEAPEAPNAGARARRREPVDLTPDSLAESLYARRGELRSIARRHGVSLDELARRSALPELSSGIASLRSLAEARASLLLARAKGDAARLLLSIASGSDSDETRRKACVDILKAQATEPARTREEEDDDAVADGAASSLLALLERLGDPAREMISPPPPDPPPGPPPATPPVTPNEGERDDG